jgi:hypothetical protein
MSDDLPTLGHNTPDGCFHCGVCPHVSRPFPSFEMIEAHAVAHLREAHGRRVWYATETDTGRRKDTPG